uniref:sushi, nidogen and EGF-like domain-containing protein 1 n=1 Tax=Styela clava TaxID=7725 RepID=UPI0019398AE6|nr:sushi, nidogen and EGF-like domain-containing protein 1 [Styela clava]
MAGFCFVLNVLVAVLTVHLLIVGTPVYAEDVPCPDRCNLRQGYCTPLGQCRCFAGWEGKNCNQCTKAPGCVHGTCHQSWQCTCDAGWGGPKCDRDLKICERTQPCKNQATCINNGNGEYLCVCQKGFSGVNCEIYKPEGMPAIKPTTTKPTTTTRATTSTPKKCTNGGRCRITAMNGGCERCICQPGYVGKYCEINVNECLLRPCANGGKCFDLSNDFYCQCQRGFTGRYCDVDVNECEVSSDICFNGGQCKNSYGSYECICPKGFSGRRCGESDLLEVPGLRPVSPRIVSVTATVTETSESTTEKMTESTVKSPKIIKNPENEIKMTRITHELKISSVNGEYSASNNELLIRQEVERDSAATDSSAKAMQAMTFVFMGLAIVILAAILALVWMRCFRTQAGAGHEKVTRTRPVDCETPTNPSVISSIDENVQNSRYETVTARTTTDVVLETSNDEMEFQIQPSYTSDPAETRYDARQSLPDCPSPPPPYAISAVEMRRSTTRPQSGYYVALPPTPQQSCQNISEIGCRKSLNTSYLMTSNDPAETSSLLEADSPTLSHKIVV